MDVSDLIGRKVLDILNAKMPMGDYKYLVNLDKLQNGMYILTFKTDTTIQSNKIFINK